MRRRASFEPLFRINGVPHSKRISTHVFALRIEIATHGCVPPGVAETSEKSSSGAGCVLFASRVSMPRQPWETALLIGFRYSA